MPSSRPPQVVVVQRARIPLPHPYLAESHPLSQRLLFVAKSHLPENTLSCKQFVYPVTDFPLCHFAVTQPLSQLWLPCNMLELSLQVQ